MKLYFAEGEEEGGELKMYCILVVRPKSHLINFFFFEIWEELELAMN
jgi:hypothetical protein